MKFIKLTSNSGDTFYVKAEIIEQVFLCEGETTIELNNFDWKFSKETSEEVMALIDALYHGHNEKTDFAATIKANERKRILDVMDKLCETAADIMSDPHEQMIKKMLAEWTRTLIDEIKREVLNDAIRNDPSPLPHTPEPAQHHDDCRQPEVQPPAQPD